MPTLQHLPVSGLLLDLNNFRTLPQDTEVEAVQAMITVDAKHFWGLMESLIDDGFTPTENIVVSMGKDGSTLVREGNRRTAVLKLCHKLLPIDDLDIPKPLADKLSALSPDWFAANEKVPCAVFSPIEESAVKKVVSRVHGANEASSRAGWESIAKARHNRDGNQGSEPGLDILDEFLRTSRELTPLEVQLWAAGYPITVLDEALKRLAPRMGYKTSREVGDTYPKLGAFRKPFDAIIKAIGDGLIGFDRGADDGRGVRGPNFGVSAGIPSPNNNGSASNPQGTPTAPTSPPPPPAGGSVVPPGPAAPGFNSPPPAPPPAPPPPPKRKLIATPINDPRTVKRELKRLVPRGSERAKVASLIQELKDLKIEKTPHAFCYVLRSVFELSARAYCNDHPSPTGPKFTNNQGEPRYLKDILVDIITHLATDHATGKKVQSISQMLHGASTELKDAGSEWHSLKRQRGSVRGGEFL